MFLSPEFWRYFEQVSSYAEDGATIAGDYGFVYQVSPRDSVSVPAIIAARAVPMARNIAATRQQAGRKPAAASRASAQQSYSIARRP